MKLRTGLGIIVALLFVVSAAMPAEAAQNIHPNATCGAASPVSNTTVVAQGSTNAQVSMTVWQCKNGAGIYVSVNSVRDSKGFCFTGVVAMHVGNQSPRSANAGCGITDTPVMSPPGVFDVFYGAYTAKNGWLYLLNGGNVGGKFCEFDTLRDVSYSCT